MRINVEYSTQHWIFPIITIGILVILGALLIACLLYTSRCV